MAPADLSPVFDRLREVMARHASVLEVVRDEPGDYYVNSGEVRADGYRIMFGAVQTRARYVSYHLMPVYAMPELMEGASEALLRRKQGKACFNLSTVDEALLAELDDLTARSVALVRERGLLPG